MRKCLFVNSLGSRCNRPRCAPAFTLTELIIAIGILVLMLSLAGQVFNMTVQSTGQATALTQVNQLLRAFERALRDDLRHVRPGQSLLLIQGNPVNAYWTQAGKEADNDANPVTGYPHIADPTREEAGNMVKPRADILMFFTTRKTASFVHPEVTSQLQQVVYGHATLGEYAIGGTGSYEFDPNQVPGMEAFPIDESESSYPSPDEVSPVPAEGWHLARRSVLLVSAAPPPAVGSGVSPWVDANPPTGTAEAFGLADPRILRSETDVVGNFDYEQWVQMPGELAVWPDWYLPNIFNGGRIGGVNIRVGGLHIPHARSEMDPTPPAPYAHRLGHYFLPNCASFKVEWMLDPRSEFVAGRLDGTREVYWFDPGDAGDPTNPLRALVAAAEAEAAEAAGNETLEDNLTRLFRERTPHLDGLSYSLADRFGNPGLAVPDHPLYGPYFHPEYTWDPPLGADGRPNLVVFGAARRNLGPLPGSAADDEFVAEDIFPGALRITMDVYDGERRLDRPVRHVMVVPVGGE